MPSQEFIVSLRYCLRISIFPPVPNFTRRPCGFVIDTSEDHVLGCGDDPLCIRRHNALCELVLEHSVLIIHVLNKKFAVAVKITQDLMTYSIPISLKIKKNTLI